MFVRVRVGPALIFGFWGLLLVAGAARAQDDTDTEIAKKHFVAGSAAYQYGDYEGALREFRDAQLARPLPALWFNIAKCLDRLERYEEAIEAYRQFAVATPKASEIAEVRDRVRVIKARLEARKTLDQPLSTGPRSTSPRSTPGAAGGADEPTSSAGSAWPNGGAETAAQPERGRSKWIAGVIIGGVLLVGGVAAGVAGAALYDPGAASPTRGNVSPGFQGISP